MNREINVNRLRNEDMKETKLAEMLDLVLLGAPQLLLNGNPITDFKTKKAQALLYYLAVTGRSHARAVLAALLWGDLTETKARVNLSTALSELRRVVGDHIVAKGQQIRFDRESRYWLDVEFLESSLTDLAAGKNTEPLRRAVDLYRGDFLEGFYVRNAADFESWLLAERDRLRALAVQALRTLSTSLAHQEEWPQAIGYTKRLLTIEPWREEAHRELMRLYARAGQQAAAMRHYKVCVETLEEELGVRPAKETTELFEAIRSRRFPAFPHSQQEGRVIAAVAAVGTAQIRPSNLPVQPTPFVGREQELTNILDRLQDPECRLLTLVGPGGIGKTRLAIETAQRLTSSLPVQDGFAQGIFFVSLQPVGSVSGVVSAIAEMTNFQFHSDAPPREQLIDYLRSKCMLLVLDNFEQLLAGADLVSDILASAQGVKILVTSREALKLREEWFHPITGMRFSKDKEDGQQPVPNYDAVRLFVQHARRAQPRFSLMQEQEHVLRICRLVDGMPLGIELAAAWLKVLTSAQVAGEIDRGLEILTARHQDLPERHRSMPRPAGAVLAVTV